MPARGVIVAASRSGSGKTTLTLAITAALRRRGLAPGRVLTALAIAAVWALAVLPANLALTAIGAVGLATLALAVAARRAIGGHTGDVLGAASVIAECVALSVLSVDWGG